MPAISRLIEEAPAGAHVTAVIEIADYAEEQPPTTTTTPTTSTTTSDPAGLERSATFQ
ncbi:SIP domain-containing protein [Salana multivorans]